MGTHDGDRDGLTEAMQLLLVVIGLFVAVSASLAPGYGYGLSIAALALVISKQFRVLGIVIVMLLAVMAIFR